MTVTVSLQQTGRSSTRSAQGYADRVLQATCEESVKILRRLIREELHSGIAHAEISELAKERIPALANLTTLVEKYGRCFGVEEVEDGVALFIDRNLLKQQGLPERLPEILEYGDPIGISPMAHLRTAWYRFQRESVRRLSEKITNALI